MVMETQQLKRTDCNGSHKMATVLTFSKAGFLPGHPPPLPYGNTSRTQILYFPAPHNTQNKTQPSGLDNEMDLIQRLSRKSETALSELLTLPASSEVVLSAAPYFGVGMGKRFHSGDICLVIGP